MHQLGPGVAKWSSGGKVYGLVKGVRISDIHGLLIKKPARLSWVEAASIVPENYTTAFQRSTAWCCPILCATYQAVVKINVKYGEIKKDDGVLVHAGASGVELAAIQISHRYDVRAFQMQLQHIELVSQSPHRNTVTAAASARGKLKWLLSILNGTMHAVSCISDDFAEQGKTTTSGKGVDVVIGVVGQIDWKKNIDSLAG